MIYFQILAIILAIFTLTTIHPIYSVLGLITVLIIISCYLLSLSITFIGLSYLIIYVGAIAILFLFVIMMMNIQFMNFIEPISIHLPILLFIIIILELLITKYDFSTIDILFINNKIDWENELISLNEIEKIAYNLYSNLGLYLFIMGLILLIGMIGPIILCL
jgi:NADH-ubiquinone oxidoreductase chain 6